MRARRNSQPSPVIQEKSQSIARSIDSRLRHTELKIVACYRAQDGEVDLEPVIETLLSSHVKVVIPVVRERRMQFSLIEPNTEFRIGPFGIEEPSTLEIVSAYRIDLVLAPLVAFSSSGHRLGRGSGYYDQVFLNNDRTALVGVGYDFQHSEEFSTHANDKPLDAVVTESGWRVFRTNTPWINEEVSVGG
ncbi:MAG: 5-formyltetrahydrofolate cyclo-ligase [Gammaproteobacteria bacterium]|nr:5-formyltetrahydrofolate cyclo-ligase [Gammaproteobacteria bacterium]MYF37342.1 5-formyltetrahydrofolate cyclo-ligase [Gammaproteobacteria bacterium]